MDQNSIISRRPQPLPSGQLKSWPFPRLEKILPILDKRISVSLDKICLRLLLKVTKVTSEHSKMGQNSIITRRPKPLPSVQLKSWPFPCLEKIHPILDNRISVSLCTKKVKVNT